MTNSQKKSTEALAKRGDLVVICATGRTSTTPGSGLSERSESVTLGRVSSVSREGQVKAWQAPITRAGELSTRKAERERFDRLMIVGASVLDVDAAIEAFRAHTWGATGSTGDMVRSFESVSAAREFLRPFRL